MEQKMPGLTVAAPAVAIENQVVAESAPTPVSLLMVIRFAALGMGMVGSVIAIQRRFMLGMALTLLCLTIGIGSYFVGQIVPVVEAKRESATEVSMSQAELGQQVFVAKGCITCHANTNVADSRDFRTIEMGAPELSKFSASAEILEIRLKNPQDVKSDTQMPNLNLSGDEIEALIAFINSN